MSDLITVFRDQAQALWHKISDEGGLQETVSALRQRMAEADRRRAVAKARGQLRELEAQIEDLVTAVGVQAVGLYRSGRLQSPELDPLCQHVAELQRTLEEQEAELTRLEAKLEASRDAEASQERQAASNAAPEASATETAAAPAEQSRRCPACGKSLPKGDFAFCPYCAKALPPQEPLMPSHCASCGAELRAGASFCSVCGTPVSRSEG